RKRLLTQKEFFQKTGCTKRSQYIGKSYQFERILGADYIARSAKSLGVANLIKVPIKYAVLDLEVPNTQNLTMNTPSRIKDSISSRDLQIYAEKITRIDRKATRQEMTLLLDFIYKIRFFDTIGRNIIWGKNTAGEEGIFLIDTEMDSFLGSDIAGSGDFF